MANEISLTAKLSVTANSVTVTNATSTKTQSIDADFDVTNPPALHHTLQEVGTSEEAVDLGDIDTTNATGDEYMLLLANRDATNYVDVFVKLTEGSPDTYKQIGRMRPGEFWAGRMVQATAADDIGGIYLKADTAACQVEVVACEAGVP